MIYSVRGALIHTESNMAVVECGGVGYKCLTTMSTVAALPKLGQEVRLFTYLAIREDAADLFGFYDMRELECFRMLIGVTGVGPKVALAILSSMTTDQFALAVAAGDVKQITRAPGVGPKLAQRIVLELKDKLSSGEAPALSGGSDLPTMVAQVQSSGTEAISALVALGYDQSQAASAIAKLDQSLSVEEMIKAALRAFATGR